MTQEGGRFRILPDSLLILRGHLLQEAPLESVAGSFVGWWLSENTMQLLFRDAAVATAHDYVRRGPAGAVVRPEFLAPLVKRCRATGEGLLLTHTHPFSTHPAFSGIDDGGEDDLIPKMRARVEESPLGGLVVGTVGLAARAWSKSDKPLELTVRVTGSSLNTSVSAPRYARQDLALGPGTSGTLENCAIGIIGTGGLGWEIATLLWSHGIGRLVLVDPDVIEMTNLPRLRGSTPSMVGVPKVEGLSRLLRSTRETGYVRAISRPFSDRVAREAVADMDILVTCTDNLTSRLDADRFARRLLIPLLDCGINIDVTDEFPRVGGRVNVSWPTGPCLACMGVLSADAVAAEVDPLGYRGLGKHDDPAVAAFNAVVGGLAVVEALALLLPIRAHKWLSRYLVYDGVNGRVREIATPEANHCRTCGDLAGAVFGSLP